MEDLFQDYLHQKGEDLICHELKVLKNPYLQGLLVQ